MEKSASVKKTETGQELPQETARLLGDGREEPSAKQYKQSVVYEYLKTSIITGKLPPEKQLIEREICEKLGVSRTPVREAFRQLSSEGLVDFLPGRGVAVSGLSKERAEQMYELKEALECMAARLCARRADEELVARLENCLRMHEAAFRDKSMEMAADVDLQFHILLVEGARSPLIEQSAKALLLQTRRLSQLAVYDADQTENFIAQHRAICQAIKEKKEDEAAAAISYHINFIKQFQWERWRMLF